MSEESKQEAEIAIPVGIALAIAVGVEYKDIPLIYRATLKNRLLAAGYKDEYYELLKSKTERTSARLTKLLGRENTELLEEFTKDAIKKVKRGLDDWKPKH